MCWSVMGLSRRTLTPAGKSCFSSQLTLESRVSFPALCLSDVSGCPRGMLTGTAGMARDVSLALYESLLPWSRSSYPWRLTLSWKTFSPKGEIVGNTYPDRLGALSASNQSPGRLHELNFKGSISVQETGEIISPGTFLRSLR